MYTGNQRATLLNAGESLEISKSSSRFGAGRLGCGELLRTFKMFENVSRNITVQEETGY